MEFKPDDIVSYSNQGVCRFIGLVERCFGDTTNEYYELQPIYQDNFSIFVPVKNEKMVAEMRKVLSAEEIYEMIRSVQAEEPAWIEDEAERRQYYRELIVGGDKKALLLTVKALYRHKIEQQSKGKKLHQADERFFKEAEDLLYHEFALALNIKPEQVLPFIIEQIEGSEK